MSTVLNRHQAVARLRSVPSRRSIGEKKFHFFLKYPPSKSLERRSRLNQKPDDDMSTVADHRTSETLDFTNQFVVFGREPRSQSSFPLLPSVEAFLPPRLDLRKRNSHEFIEIPHAGSWPGKRAPDRPQSARGS